jgi:hypothetical protein
MISLGLRLTLNGGKEAAIRLAVTAAAVALGVGMLLITLAGINALNAQNARAAWLNTSPFFPAGMCRGRCRGWRTRPGRRPGLEGICGDWQASFESNVLSADGGWVTGQVLSPNGSSVLGR